MLGPALILGAVAYPQPMDWNLDQYRCAEVDGVGHRCQLVVRHDGQHVLQRDGQRFMWPIDAGPHARPPWAVSFPRDDET